MAFLTDLTDKFIHHLLRSGKSFKSYLSSSISNSSKSLRLWAKKSAIPRIHDTSELIVRRLTYEEGSAEWAALVPSNRWNRYIIWTLVSVAGFGIVWSMFAHVDETVSAIGKLEPLGTIIDVKPPLGGVIKDILVKDGQLVDEGQTLIVLDTTAAKARLAALLDVQERTKVDLLLSQSQLGVPIDQSKLTPNQKLRLSALKQEYSSRIMASENNVKQASAQLDSFRKQLTSKEKALAIREQILLSIKPLVEFGAMAKSQYLKELKEVELLRGDVQSLLSNIDRSEAAVAEAINKLKNTKSLSLIDFSTKVEETQKQISQLTNQISETNVTLSYQELVAPTDGVVFDLQAATPGYVVNSERPILKIVPSDNLVARVFVPNKDIGFLRPSQKVKVRVDAFPYNEFGEIEGTVKSIGSDVLEPDEQFNYYRFPVTVDLSDIGLSYRGRSLPLVSGMSVSANIVLRQRPVIAIFTEQILPFWDNLEKL